LNVKNYIIDTDLALGTLNADPDDGIAILNLISNKVDISLISLVGGNVPIYIARNNLDLLLRSIDYSGKKIPFFKGNSNDLAFENDYFFWRKWQKNYYEIETSYPYLLEVSENIEDYFASENIIFGLGPLTNLANFYNKNFINKTNSKIFWMGGNNDSDNFYEEFNISHDIKSFESFLNSGIEFNIFPLDQTKRVEFNLNELSLNLVSYKYKPLYRKMFKNWLTILKKNNWSKKGITLHDCLPVFAFFNPEKVSYNTFMAYSNMNICVDFDTTAFKKFVINNL